MDLSYDDDEVVVDDDSQVEVFILGALFVLPIP